MPHDRLYRESEDATEPWKYQTIVEQVEEEGQVFLRENIEEISDPWIKLYLEIEQHKPELDSISMSKQLNQEGVMNRVVKAWRNLTGRRMRTDNIFAPTATLQLFSHIHKLMPNHHMILADFDSFIMPRK